MLAALELGVADFDASVGGLGGCPYAPGATGNIATEELVHMVEDMGVATGVDLAAMIDAAADAERIVGRQLPSQVLRAGPGPGPSGLTGCGRLLWPRALCRCAVQRPVQTDHWRSRVLGSPVRNRLKAFSCERRHVGAAEEERCRRRIDPLDELIWHWRMAYRIWPPAAPGTHAATPGEIMQAPIPSACPS